MVVDDITLSYDTVIIFQSELDSFKIRQTDVQSNSQINSVCNNGLCFCYTKDIKY